MITAKGIEEKLQSLGIGDVVTTNKAAELLKIQPRTIRKKKAEGKIPREFDENAIRGCVTRTSLVKWLCSEPRFLARL